MVRSDTEERLAQEPDEVIEHGLPERCDGCGETLPLSCVQIADRRQVFDMPVVRYKAIEHRTYVHNFRQMKSYLNPPYNTA